MTLPHLTFPAHVNLDVTYKCNASCSFCYIIDQDAPLVQHTDISKLEKIIFRLAEAGALRINFFGGEPLLLKELPYLIKYAKSLDLRTTLISNGLPVSSRFCEEVAGHLDTMAISIHGLQPDHDRILGIPGAFEKILSRLELLQRSNIDVGINYTVIEGADKHFLDLARRLIGDYGVKFVSANRFIGGRDKKDRDLTPSLDTLNNILDSFEIIESQFPDVTLAYAIYFPLCLVRKASHRRFLKACGMGSNYCSVDFNGNMKLCSYAKGTVGNLLAQDPVALWNNSEILDRYRAGSWIPDACQTCSLFSTCLSGCRVSDPSGDFGPDILTKIAPITPIAAAQSERIDAHV
ncbi:radical SAM protein [Bradyrhizobium sp. MOS001]|uniref:radical SAM/SPASM domain-containing protein n=1 Tax=Bradyrhizobium sp. MOS001 TaxID=2133948 RepID=UPI0010751840|nr:radical SAM protein [Bradyrhizobium sp. MOS001]TFW51794.1 radical SAM protein [Bradyrhizobium sp. MOS001]